MELIILHDMLKQIDRKLKKHFASCFETEGITGREFRIMQKMDSNEAISLSELANRMKRANSNLTVIIDSLEKKKVVKRLFDDKDRRVIKIKYTEEGLLIRDKIMQNHNTEVNKLYSGMSDEMKNDLYKSLEYLTEKLQVEKEKKDGRI